MARGVAGVGPISEMMRKCFKVHVFAVLVKLGRYVQSKKFLWQLLFSFCTWFLYCTKCRIFISPFILPQRAKKKKDNLRFISMLWPKRAAFTPACSEVGKSPTRVSFFLWFLVPSSIGTKTSSLLIVLSLGLSMKVLLFCTLVRAEPLEKKLCGQGHVAIQTRQAKKGAASVYRGFKSIRKLTHFLHCLHMSQSGDHSRGVRIGKPGQRPRKKKKDISGGNRGLRTISHFLVQTSISKNHRCFSVILVSSQKL